MAAPASQRLIKKYPNRRLYDTATSSYITLSDVKQLVIAANPFVVVDAKTGDDLTRSILLQIILEEEAGGVPMLSSAMLAQMIRFYGHAMQGLMGAHLEKNLQFFVEMQERLASQIPPSGGADAWAQLLGAQPPGIQNWMSSYVDQSRQMIEQMQAQSQRLFGGFAPGFGFGAAGPAADAGASAAAAQSAPNAPAGGPQATDAKPAAVPGEEAPWAASATFEPAARETERAIGDSQVDPTGRPETASAGPTRGGTQTDDAASAVKGKSRARTPVRPPGATGTRNKT